MNALRIILSLSPRQNADGSNGGRGCNENHGQLAMYVLQLLVGVALSKDIRRLCIEYVYVDS